MTIHQSNIFQASNVYIDIYWMSDLNVYTTMIGFQSNIFLNSNIFIDIKWFYDWNFIWVLNDITRPVTAACGLRHMAAYITQVRACSMIGYRVDNSSAHC